MSTRQNDLRQVEILFDSFLALLKQRNQRRFGTAEQKTKDVVEKEVKGLKAGELDRSHRDHLLNMILF